MTLRDVAFSPHMHTLKTESRKATSLPILLPTPEEESARGRGSQKTPNTTKQKEGDDLNFI
jgi:hypothetical protein